MRRYMSNLQTKFRWTKTCKNVHIKKYIRARETEKYIVPFKVVLKLNSDKTPVTKFVDGNIYREQLYLSFELTDFNRISTFRIQKLCYRIP